MGEGVMAGAENGELVYENISITLCHYADRNLSLVFYLCALESHCFGSVYIPRRKGVRLKLSGSP